MRPSVPNITNVFYQIPLKDKINFLFIIRINKKLTQPFRGLAKFRNCKMIVTGCRNYISKTFGFFKYILIILVEKVFKNSQMLYI